MQSIKNLEFYQCRSCYDSTSNLQPLTNLAEPSPLAGDKTYVQLLREVCNINIMDDKPLGRWPQFICLNCSRKLKMAHDFKQKTLKVNQLLHSIADLMQIRGESESIEDPELDIPLEIKTEMDEDMLTVSSETMFQYSPVGAEEIKVEPSLPTHEMYKEYFNTSSKEALYQKNSSKITDNSNIRENNDGIFRNSLDKFHNKLTTNLNISKHNDRTGSAANDKLLNASNTSNSNGTTSLRCDECHKFFPSALLLDKHKYLVHTPEYHKTHCDICNQDFARSYNYRRHMKSVHNHDISLLHLQSQPQPKSQQQPQSQSKLQPQPQSQPNPQPQAQPRPQTQPKIPVLMKQNPKIIKNSNSTVKLQSRPYLASITCKICKKIFANRDRLSRHERYSHLSDEEKITCHLCGHKSARPDNFQSHMKRVHYKNAAAPPENDNVHNAEDKESFYSCYKCDRNFSRRSALIKHERDMHGQGEDFQ